jgi:glycosyltransferase involved in cell wall biosynthesis
MPTVNPSSAAPTYTVVVPFFNEAESLGSLLTEIFETMQSLGQPWQAVFVDDGSADATGEKLVAITAGWPDCEVIRFAENRGQAAALWVGFQAARGTWIVTLDGDGQNVPADLATLLPLTQAYDMVVGVRAQRRDSWLRRKMSRVANRVRGKVLRDGLSDSGCALKVFRREVAESFLPLRTLYSFMPAFAVAAGYRVTEVPVRHRERRAGQSSYGLRAMAWRPLADMLAVWWMTRRRLDTRPPRRK